MRQAHLVRVSEDGRESTLALSQIRSPAAIPPDVFRELGFVVLHDVEELFGVARVWGCRGRILRKRLSGVLVLETLVEFVRIVEGDAGSRLSPCCDGMPLLLSITGRNIRVRTLPQVEFNAARTVSAGLTVVGALWGRVSAVVGEV